MRTYRLERVGEAAVVQVYADGFTSLPLDQKQLIWHLYRAAIAGRDIFYDQRYAHNLDMRDVLEAIVSRPGVSETDPEAFRELERYTKLFWINSGPYNNLTARKFVLNTTPEAFAAAAVQAQGNGASFPIHVEEHLSTMLERMEPLFFDLTVDPVITSKTPGEGKD